MSFFFSSRRRHTRCSRDWSSDVCSSDLLCHRFHGLPAQPVKPPVGKHRPVLGLRCGPSGDHLPCQPSSFKPTLPGSQQEPDRKSTRLNSSHGYISYAVFCLKKKNNPQHDGHSRGEPCPPPARQTHATPLAH